MLRIIATAELGSSSGFSTNSTSSSSKKCAGVILVGRNLFCHHFALIKHLASPRRGYRYKIIIIWLRQFSLRIWRELVIGDGAVTLTI